MLNQATELLMAKAEKAAIAESGIINYLLFVLLVYFTYSTQRTDVIYYKWIKYQI